MTIHKATLALTLCVLGLFFSIVPVLATSTANVIATVALNVRSGPGTNYNPIDTLYAGEVVQIIECQQSWCSIDHSGPNGWVSSQYLRSTNQPYLVPDNGTANQNPILEVPFFKEPVFEEPRFEPNPTFVPGFPVDPLPVPTIAWPFQSGPQNPILNPSPILKPSPIPTEPEFQVCLYSQTNYSGNSTCVLSGRSFEQLGPRWNNKISSFQVFPGASVTLCQSGNFQGFCQNYQQNIPALGQPLNNNVSSLWVD